MDQRNLAHIVASRMTVSDKIRALNAAGMARAEIARSLGKRYQHVRNVLEEDKLKVSPRRAAAARAEGVEEGARVFGYQLRLEVNADGWVYLPPEVRAVVGGENGAVVAELLEDRLEIVSPDEGLRRAVELREFYGNLPGRLVSEELILDRRVEVAREEAEDHARRIQRRGRR